MSRSSRNVCRSSMSPTTTRLLDPTGLDFHIEAGFFNFSDFFFFSLPNPSGIFRNFIVQYFCICCELI